MTVFLEQLTLFPGTASALSPTQATVIAALLVAPFRPCELVRLVERCPRTVEIALRRLREIGVVQKDMHGRSPYRLAERALAWARALPLKRIVSQIVERIGSIAAFVSPAPRAASVSASPMSFPMSSPMSSVDITDDIGLFGTPSVNGVVRKYIENNEQHDAVGVRREEGHRDSRPTPMSDAKTDASVREGVGGSSLDAETKALLKRQVALLEEQAVLLRELLAELRKCPVALPGTTAPRPGAPRPVEASLATRLEAACHEAEASGVKIRSREKYKQGILAKWRQDEGLMHAARRDDEARSEKEKAEQHYRKLREAEAAEAERVADEERAKRVAAGTAPSVMLPSVIDRQQPERRKTFMEAWEEARDAALAGAPAPSRAMTTA